jgi:S-adenosylmethionine-diacylglycerol 3-amino-3-carboxypropyl transferase
LRFFGFPPYDPSLYQEERAALYKSLQLSKEARHYFDRVFAENGMHGLIYEGKWEQTILAVPRILRHVLGDRYDEIFSFTNMAEQNKYFDVNLASWRFTLPLRLVVAFFGNAAFFNAMLYRGSFVRKNSQEGYFNFYRQAFRRLFRNGLTRENFFLQMCFLGKIAHPEGSPIEAAPQTFQRMKAALRNGSVVTLKLGDCIDYAKTAGERFDLVSLSDVPSYFAGECEQTYMRDLSACLNPGAVVVIRCYLRTPEGTDFAGYEDVTAQYASLIAQEKMQVYDITVMRYRGSP